MDAQSERMAQRFEVPILVAALLVIPVIVIEESSVGQPWDGIATVLNWAIWLAFLAEVVAMLAVVPDRWRWVRQHPLEVIVVVLTPPFLQASLAAIRVLRLLRLVRLLRLAQVVRRLFTFEGLRYAALLALMTLIGGGTAFASVEEEPTAWDGIWWAITTMTTVGYGDVPVTTNAGRVIAIIVMVVGIGFGTLVIGAISERFITPQVEREVEEAEQEAVEELQGVEAEVLRELRAMSARLQQLEMALQQRGS
jgi:voltage-gated potassium channel